VKLVAPALVARGAVSSSVLGCRAIRSAM
jgi:hypothetical protein